MALLGQQKTLLIRATSALIAAFVVASLFYFYGQQGLKCICIFAALWGSRELVRLLFSPEESRRIRICFFMLTIFVFLASSWWPEKSGLVFSLSSIFFLCFSLLGPSRLKDLSELTALQAKGILGFFYLGLLPSTAYRLLDLPNGAAWFLCMLIIVFSGDTCAYLVGTTMGKIKLLPEVSPKKTVEGAIGGLIGSVAASGALSMYFERLPLWPILSMGLLVGVVAQVGDLFESLLKRAANKKDSGTLMPGHGGVLDRLDGVFFAAPVVLFFAERLGN